MLDIVKGFREKINSLIYADYLLENPERHMEIGTPFLDASNDAIMLSIEDRGKEIYIYSEDLYIMNLLDKGVPIEEMIQSIGDWRGKMRYNASTSEFELRSDESHVINDMFLFAQALQRASYLYRRESASDIS